MLSFFPRGVLDEILNLIESVSEEFPSYSFMITDNILIPHLEITAYTVHTGYKGKIEENNFFQRAKYIVYSLST